MATELLQYRDSQGSIQTVKDCHLTQVKNGRFYIWSEALQHNLAYNMQTKEDALMASINSLLFTIEIQQKKIEGLQKVYDMAEALADYIKPDSED